MSRVLTREVQLVQAQSDPLEDPELLQDQLDLAFICGLPFSRYCQSVPQQLQASVAPVMQAPRYHNRPIYFADVIVKATSDFTDLESLKGSTFATTIEVLTAAIIWYSSACCTINRDNGCLLTRSRRVPISNLSVGSWQGR